MDDYGHVSRHSQMSNKRPSLSNSYNNHSSHRSIHNIPPNNGIDPRLANHHSSRSRSHSHSRSRSRPQSARSRSHSGSQSNRHSNHNHSSSKNNHHHSGRLSQKRNSELAISKNKNIILQSGSSPALVPAELVNSLHLTQQPSMSYTNSINNNNNNNNNTPNEIVFPVMHVSSHSQRSIHSNHNKQRSSYIAGNNNNNNNNINHSVERSRSMERSRSHEKRRSISRSHSHSRSRPQTSSNNNNNNYEHERSVSRSSRHGMNRPQMNRINTMSMTGESNHHVALEMQQFQPQQMVPQQINHMKQHSTSMQGMHYANGMINNNGMGPVQMNRNLSRPNVNNNVNNNVGTMNNDDFARASSKRAASRNWFLFGLVCLVACVICFSTLGEKSADETRQDGGMLIMGGLLCLVCMVVGFVQGLQAKRAADDPLNAEM